MFNLQDMEAADALLSGGKVIKVAGAEYIASAKRATQRGTETAAWLQWLKTGRGYRLE